MESNISFRFVHLLSYTFTLDHSRQENCLSKLINPLSNFSGKRFRRYKQTNEICTRDCKNTNRFRHLFCPTEHQQHEILPGPLDTQNGDPTGLHVLATTRTRGQHPTPATRSAEASGSHSLNPKQKERIFSTSDIRNK